MRTINTGIANFGTIGNTIAGQGIKLIARGVVVRSRFACYLRALGECACQLASQLADSWRGNATAWMKPRIATAPCMAVVAKQSRRHDSQCHRNDA